VSSVVPWQTFDALVQFGSALHVQVPAPVQLWCALAHAVPAFHAVHPLPCTLHVWTPRPPHRVDAFVHAFVQHCALPAPPKHAPFVHGDVVAA
jgi:hypothetical protein